MADAPNGNGNGNGVNRLGVWASVAGVVLVVLGALFVLYAEVSTAYTTAQDLKERVERMSQQVSDDRVTIARLQSDQIELDTQLRASIDEDNKSIAWQNRMNSMLWEQAFHGKSHFPTDNPDFPNIANGNSR